MALDKIKTAMIEDAAVTAAKAAADVATTASVTAAELDADKIQTNLAILAFKTATTGSLAKYSLKDQIVDEFVDATGVDASASTNEVLTAGVYSGLGQTTPTVTHNAQATGTHGDYTWYKWTTVTTSGSYVTDTTQNYDYLVVAGGGSSGRGDGSVGGNGGSGAGGLLTAAGFSLPAATYAISVGDGGTGLTSGHGVGTSGGNSSIVHSGITDIITTGGGFGGVGKNPYTSGGDGGSGGGAGGDPSGVAGGTRTADPVQGNDGGDSGAGGGSGGGGAGAVGANSTSNAAVAGGIGTKVIMGMTDANSTLFLAAASAGHSSGSYRYFAGGGGSSSNGSQPVGAGGLGGGGTGGISEPSGSATSGTAGTDGTGGGAGGSGYPSQNGLDGGSGIVIIRRLTTVAVVGNLTLQSTDTAAETEADYADMVMLIEDAAGTAVINTDVKGFISEDSGVTFTEGVLVDEGDWGTNKRILAFHDLDISAQSGTAMCYKITTHNQSASKETKIHATSIGWR